MERTVETDRTFGGTVTLTRPLLRHPGNPILTAHDVNEVWAVEPHLMVVTAHNAGVAVLPEGDTVMLFRSHLRSGVSVLGLARSTDGVGDWRVTPGPVLGPATVADALAPGVDREQVIASESGGVEDARINPVDDTFAVTYSAYHGEVRDRVRVSLAVTTDCTTFVRCGPMLTRDMRNVVIFPERIGGRHVALFRPNDTLPGAVGGSFTQIRIGYADDFRTGPWEIAAEPVMQTGAGPSAFANKIGPGAPPIPTRHGYLNLFHGVRSTMDGNPYVLGVALHDGEDPRRIRMSSIPVLFPSRADCRVDEADYVHVPNVVFTCGAVRRPDGSVLIYYGGNDTVMNVAVSHEDVLAELCLRFPQDATSGRLGYAL